MGNRIAEFLRGKTLLITGATGFLGQPLVEKILWTAPDVRRVYVLIRPKRQTRGRETSAQQRLEKELYGSSVFDRLYAAHGDETDAFLQEKVSAVQGDISLEDLGLTTEVAARLREEVDIVVNSAAVVSFDAPLDAALDLNVFGARRLAEFARTCRPQAVVHVSTAYVCGTTDEPVSEELYHSDPASEEEFPLRAFRDVEVDIARIRSILEGIHSEAHSAEMDRAFAQVLMERSRKGKRHGGRRREVVEKLRRQWIREQLVARGMEWARERGWNDTYTYTKALGEQIVAGVLNGIPTAIIRPSVIESSLSEPSPGWLDGLRMADPLIAAIGKGRLKALPLNPEVVLDLVPVDMVVNALLASIPEAAQKGGLRVYQVATGSRNPITLGRLYDLIHQYFVQNPMLDREGKPIRIKRLKYHTPARFRFHHRLRSVPLDTAERTLNRLAVFDSAHRFKRRISAIRAANERLYYYGEIYEPYLNLDCLFRVDRTLALFERLSDDEKKLFNFDVARLNWRHYIQNVHIPGVKKYILKIEGVGTLEVAHSAAAAQRFTIPRLLERAAERFGDKTALQIKRDQVWQRTTYSQLKASADEISARLRRFGLAKGERVVLFSENQPEWGKAYLGASSAGLVVVPLDSQTWHREVWSVARFTGAKAILSSSACLERLTDAELEENEAAPAPVLLLNVDAECAPFDKKGFPRSTSPPSAPTEPAAPEVLPQDEASIIFTSGTAVDPRGAVHTHANFINNLLGVHHYAPVLESDHLLAVLPLYHALAFTCGFLMPIYGGATVSYASALKPRVLLEFMREVGATCLLGVPTLFAMIRDDIERRVLGTSKSRMKSNWVATSKQLSHSVERRFGKNIGRALFSRIHQEFGGRIRLIVSGGSALGAEIYDDFKAMGLPIYEGYGLTETAPVLTVNPVNRSRRRSAGKALPGVELRLHDPDEHGVGEIVVRTPCLMKGYWNNPEATEKVVKGNWFHTGDLGSVDADGYVYITGRTKDVIVTGAGKNVYPIDLEAIYRGLPQIDDICVVGIKSGLTEEVHAAVKPSDPSGGGPPAEVKKAIQKAAQALGRELPSYHRLQGIHLWEGDLPRGARGELDRAQVLARIESLTGRRGEQVAGPAGKSSTRQAVLKELSRVSGTAADELDLDAHLYSELGFDSLTAIELLLFLEHEIGVSLPDERAAAIETVGELLEEVESRKALEATRPSERRLVRSTLPFGKRTPLDRFLFGCTLSSLQTLYRTYFRLLPANGQAVPSGRPYILAANHSSHLDIGAVLSAVKTALGTGEARRLHTVGARDYFFDTPLKSWFFSSFLNVFPIEREETSLAGLKMVRSILSTGESVLIFPEGTRSRSGRVNSFKPGLGLIALELDIPIVPVCIQGTYESMPAGRFFPRRRTVRVHFGPPVWMDSYRLNGVERPAEIYRRIASDVQERVAEISARTDEPS